MEDYHGEVNSVSLLQKGTVVSWAV